MAYDPAAIDKALKIKYQRGLPFLLYKKSPFFAWVPKTTNFTGKKREVTVNYTGTPAYATYAAAHANATEGEMATFEVTRKKIFNKFLLDGEAMKASADDAGALMRLLELATKHSMKGFERQSEFALFHSGGGARGQIAAGSVVGTPTITLTNKKDTRWFMPGQVLELSADDGVSGSAGVESGTVTVLSVNRKLGTITATGNWTAGIATAAVGQYIFQEDDYQNVPHSIFSWIPPTEALAATTFLTQDRSLDTTALAGVRIDVQGSTTEDAIIDMLAEADVQSAEVDTIWVSSGRFAELQKNVHGKTYFMADVKLEPHVSIKGIQFAGGPMGSVNVLKDPAMPDDYALATKRDIWELHSADDWPHFSTEDGLKLARVHNADQVEGVIKAYGNLLCKEPLHNVLANFAA
jgi:hypothetical protein